MLLHRLLVDNITTMNVLYKYVHNNITVYIFYFFVQHVNTGAVIYSLCLPCTSLLVLHVALYVCPGSPYAGRYYTLQSATL